MNGRPVVMVKQGGRGRPRAYYEIMAFGPNPILVPCKPTAADRCDAVPAKRGRPKGPTTLTPYTEAVASVAIAKLVADPRLTLYGAAKAAAIECARRGAAMGRSELEAETRRVQKCLIASRIMHDLPLMRRLAPRLETARLVAELVASARAAAPDKRAPSR